MTAITRPSFSPLALQSRSPALRLAAVAFGTLVLAVSSQIEVPMIPVPITLQTLVVPLIGAPVSSTQPPAACGPPPR